MTMISGGLNLDYSMQFPLHKWFHICGQFGDKKSMKLYMDGKELIPEKVLGKSSKKTQVIYEILFYFNNFFYFLLLTI